MNKKPYYITTAIAYTSGIPHIGNVYEIILADSIARFKRLEGYDVLFQTGTDEHGQKIQIKAEEKGLKPKEFVDNIAGEIKRIFDSVNISYDKFIRTTDKYHEKQIQKMFKKLYDQGDIYKGEYEGLYCIPCESFFTESQLVDGKCPDCGREVKKAKEEAYFFKLSKYQDRLVKYIEDNPNFIQPESRKNEMLNNFIKSGLQDLCVSRTSFNWGIPVSFDEKHVVYVWLDALSNYITGLGYDVDGNHSELYKKYWPADVHLIGKDILRFHTIYWPIMLMALGEELPKQVFGHPWLLVGQGKMSKSKGNVLYTDDLISHYGVDPIRYYLLHEMPFAQDGKITHELLIERINSDLVNTLGNLVHRTISMLNKYFDGKVLSPNASEDIDTELINTALKTKEQVIKHMSQLKVSSAIEDIMILLRRSNKYIDETTPWILAKDEDKKDRLATVLYNLLESIRYSVVLLQAFLPDTANKILAQLNTELNTFESLNKFGGIKENSLINQTKPLFIRIDAKEKLEEVNSKKEAPKMETPKVEEITIEDFGKLDIRVGTIKECKKHPKADRLLVSQVDIGWETRQIVSGIAKYYKPEDLVGKKVLVVTNLKPIKLRGELSQGMILAGSNDDTLEVIESNILLPGNKVK